MADDRHGWIVSSGFRLDTECPSLEYLCILVCDSKLDQGCVSVENHDMVTRSSALQLSNGSELGVFVVFSEA